MKKGSIILLTAVLALGCLAAAKAPAKAKTFSIVSNNRPCVGVKVDGYHPALNHAGEEFVRITRAVTGTRGNAYYQLILAVAGNESSAEAEKIVKELNLTPEKLGKEGFVLAALSSKKFILTSFSAKGVLNGVYKIFQKNLDTVFPRAQADLVYPPRKLKVTPIKLPYILRFPQCHSL